MALFDSLDTPQAAGAIVLLALAALVAMRKIFAAATIKIGG